MISVNLYDFGSDTGTASLADPNIFDVIITQRKDIVFHQYGFPGCSQLSSSNAVKNHTFTGHWKPGTV